MSYADTTNPNTPVSLIEKWDKTFPESVKVDHRKVTFHNRYGITLAGDLYLPKDRGDRKLAAIAVSGPFGAVTGEITGGACERPRDSFIRCTLPSTALRVTSSPRVSAIRWALHP